MIYIVLAIIASLALNAPVGLATGFVIALVVAFAHSHGTIPERVRQVLAMGHMRAITVFAIAALVINALDSWTIAAVVWLIAAFAMGAWRTHGRLAASDRWALLSRFAAAVAGLAMARLIVNWVTTPMAVWFFLVALVSVSAIRAASRWPDLPWIEHATPAKRPTAGALAALLMSALIVGASVV